MAAHRLRLLGHRPGQHPLDRHPGGDLAGVVGVSVEVDCQVKPCYSGQVDAPSYIPNLNLPAKTAK